MSEVEAVVLYIVGEKSLLNDIVIISIVITCSMHAYLSVFFHSLTWQWAESLEDCQECNLPTHEDNQSSNSIVFEYILKFFFCIIYFALQTETITLKTRMG